MLYKAAPSTYEQELHSLTFCTKQWESRYFGETTWKYIRWCCYSHGQGGKAHRNGESNLAKGGTNGKGENEKQEWREEFYTLQKSHIELPGWARAERKEKKMSLAPRQAKNYFSRACLLLASPCPLFSLSTWVSMSARLISNQFGQGMWRTLLRPYRSSLVHSSRCKSALQDGLWHSCKPSVSVDKCTARRPCTGKALFAGGDARTLWLISAVYRLIVSGWIRKTLAGMTSLSDLCRFQSSKNSALLCKVTALGTKTIFDRSLCPGQQRSTPFVKTECSWKSPSLSLSTSNIEDWS